MDSSRQARLLVAIPFHYQADRVKHLATLVRCLSEFPVAAMRIVLHTNTGAADELRILHQIFTGFAAPDYAIETVTDMESPWLLTWAHKPLITGEFRDQLAGYSHFIYVEADIALGFANFEYWLDGREALRDAGLLPGFLRFEWRNETLERTSSDVFWRVFGPGQASIVLGDAAYVSMPNPYNPLFIMDVELAAEYATSTAIDPIESGKLCPWGLAERSAMGLCMIHVPAAFPHRYVVRFDGQTGEAPAAALVHHLPDNYANNPQSPLGKTPMAAVVADIQPLVRNRVFPFSGTADFQALVASAAPPDIGDHFVMISEHDTVLYVDVDGDRIRHAPFGLAPLNLSLNWHDGRGRLLLADGSLNATKTLTFIDEDGHVCVAKDSDEPWLESTWYADSSVSICTWGKYLGARLDGCAVNSNLKCLQWERFRLVPVKTLACMQQMANGVWRSHADGVLTTLTAQPVNFGRGGGSEASALVATYCEAWNERDLSLVFGPARFSLVDRSSPVTLVGDDLSIRSGDQTYYFTRQT